MENKNKESKLEKEARIVGNAKDKYKWYDFIPFGFMNKKIRDSWKDETGKLSDKIAVNWGLSIIFALGPSWYGMESLSHGTLNYKKWPEIRQERQFQEEQKQMKEVKEQFHKLDLDNNYVLDSTEFYNYYKSKFN